MSCRPGKPERPNRPGRRGRPTPADLVRGCDPAVVLAAAGLCDGHTILAPKAFLDAGLPLAVVERLTVTYRSDGTPMGTIYVRGEAVEALTGVYGLDMLRFLAAALGVDYDPALGRGFEARNIQAALARRLLPPPPQHPPPDAG